MVTRREQHILDHCLEMVLQDGKTIQDALAHYPERADDLRPALEAALWIQKKGDQMAPRPGFIAASRDRVVDQITQKNSMRNWGRNFPVFQKQILRLALAFAVVLVFLISGEGLTSIASTAMPGDRFYSMKLEVEKSKLFFSLSEAKDAALHIEYANNRLDEIVYIMAEGENDLNASLFRNLAHHIENASLKIYRLDQASAKDAAMLAVRLNASIEEQKVVIENLVAGNVEGDSALVVSDFMNLSSATQYIMLDIISTTPTVTPRGEFIPRGMDMETFPTALRDVMNHLQSLEGRSACT